MSLLNHYLRGRYLTEVIESIIGWATSELSEVMSSLLGLPVRVKIFYNWLRVEFPGNKGLPSNSSPRMHPTLQTSALF